MNATQFRNYIAYFKAANALQADLEGPTGSR